MSKKTNEIQSTEWAVHLGLNREDIDQDPIGTIEAIVEIDGLLDQPLRHAVLIARRKRFTWEEIGRAIGLTRQAAWERYASDIADSPPDAPMPRT